MESINTPEHLRNLMVVSSTSASTIRAPTLGCLTPSISPLLIANTGLKQKGIKKVNSPIAITITTSFLFILSIPPVIDALTNILHELSSNYFFLYLYPPVSINKKIDYKNI